MIAKAWQAWAAAIVVIVGMLMLPVLGEVDSGPPDRVGVPRRYYDYDPSRAALLDQLVGASMPRPVELAPAVAWDEPAPALAHEDAEVRVTADAIGIDGDDPIPDDLALARLTVKARVDPQLTVHLRVDADLPYQRIVAVMDAIKAAGVENLALTATP